ncbi:hypothetical protein [Clostridium sp.]|uniref:glycosyl-4,4'-diaponeurosporenoate acyltransferase CrtO family protein n=1 Tax=Clostridium sp. TaxID=1506 RepID=UPI003D6D219F
MTLLEYYEYRTRASEFGHGVIAIIMVLVTIYVGITYFLKEIIWLIFHNIFFELYPIMAQRYNRPRVLRVISKLKLKQSKFTDRENIEHIIGNLNTVKFKKGRFSSGYKGYSFDTIEKQAIEKLSIG